MGVVYFEMSMSLDGFVTGPNVSNENPLGEDGELLVVKADGAVHLTFRLPGADEQRFCPS
jgi:hypothetical protein